MGVDHNESQRQRRIDKTKYARKEPIAAIEKRVIDSEAFADLSFSSSKLLLLLARNLAKGMNGHVFIARDDAERRGFDSKTLYRGFKELAAHGLIFPTSRGGHGKCGTFALTWLPLSRDTKALHLENFKHCAWRDWKPDAKKKRGGKMSTPDRQISSQTPKSLDKFPPSHMDKFPPLEFNTNSSGSRATWIDDHRANLKRHGLTGYQCFEVPNQRVLPC